MTHKNDIGAMLMAAVLLLLCISYMTQCSPAVRRVEPGTAASPAATAARQAGEGEEGERGSEGKRKSIHEIAAEEEREERAKIKAVSNALQTIAANPEMRRTYGFDK